MRAIIAVNNLGFIGLNGNLPWYSREDLIHFVGLTKGCDMFAGYRTFESMKFLGRAFSGDFLSFSLSSSRNLYLDVKGGGLFSGDIWCIGGKKTFEKYCCYFDELHISHIDDNTIGDTMFPDFSNLNRECKIFNYNFKK